jgi:PAS domain S-box-containing protein
VIDQVQERRAGFFLVDDTGTIVEANERARELTLASDDLTGRRISSVIPGDADESGGLVSVLLRDDGTDLPIFVAKVPLGEHLGVGIVDLTDPAALQAAFVPTNTVAGRLISHLDIGIVVQGEDGAILAANDAAARILDLSVDALLGRTSIDPRWRTIRTDLSDLPGEEHPAMQCLRSGDPVRSVFGVHTPSGELRWIDVHAIPLVQHQGRVVACATSFVDISAEREAAAAARDSIHRSEALLAEASDAVVIVDADGTITYAGPSTSTTLGRAPETLLGAPITDLAASPDQPGIARLLEDIVERPGSRVDSTLEIGVTGAGVRWFEVRMRNHRAEPAVGGIVVTLTDVHDRVEALEQLRRVNAELERRLVELDEEHRIDRELSLATDLLTHSAGPDEARAVVWGAVTAIFRDVPATMFRASTVSGSLTRVETTDGGPATEFSDDECWALRTHRVHRSTADDGLTCHHLTESIGTICLPLGLATDPFGLVVLSTDADPALRHAQAVAERLGPLLERPELATRI